MPSKFYKYLEKRNYDFEDRESFMARMSETRQAVMGMYRTVKRRLVYPFTYFMFDWAINTELSRPIKDSSILPVMDRLRLLHDSSGLLREYDRSTFDMHCFKYFYLHRASSMTIFFDRSRFGLNKKFVMAFSRKIAKAPSSEVLIQYSILMRLCNEVDVYMRNYKLNRRQDSEKLLIFLYIWFIAFVVRDRYKLLQNKTLPDEAQSGQPPSERDFGVSRPRVPSLLIAEDTQTGPSSTSARFRQVLDNFMSKVAWLAGNIGRKTLKFEVVGHIFGKKDVNEIYQETITDLPILFDQIVELCEYFSVKIMKTFTSFCQIISQEVDLPQLEQTLRVSFMRGTLHHLKEFLGASLMRPSLNQSGDSLHDNIVVLVEHFHDLEQRLVRLGFQAKDISLARHLSPIFDKWAAKFYAETKEIISHISYNNYSDQAHFDPKQPLSSTIDFANLLLGYSGMFSRILKAGGMVEVFKAKLRDNLTFLIKLFISREFKIQYQGESFVPSFVMSKSDIAQFVEKVFEKSQVDKSHDLAQKAIVYVNNICFLREKLFENDFYAKLLFADGQNRYLHDARHKLLNVLVQDTFHHVVRPVVIKIFLKSLDQRSQRNLGESSRIIMTKMDTVDGVVNKVSARVC